MLRKARLVVGVGALALVLSACVSHAAQDSLKPAGPYAEKINGLFTPVFWIAAAVFFLVEGAIVYFLIKYRHRPGREGVPPQIHGNTRLEIAWTIVPALIVAGIAVPTVTTVFDLARRPPNALSVNVLGHQWWWEFDYPDQKITTANEMHIPVGKPVYVTLCSVGEGSGGAAAPSACQSVPAAVGDAVIHSFWVPELAGKQDVVPARTNHLTLEASKPGLYYGQCAEFCGLSHANMRFRVIAQTPEDFDAWVLAQQKDAAVPGVGSLEAQGQDLFVGAGGVGGQCIACHAINGLQTPQGRPVNANGGPSLTHFSSRDCFAGCTFDTTTANLTRWLRNPPAMKPGSKMPNYDLSLDQIKALVAYLESLK